MHLNSLGKIYDASKTLNTLVKNGEYGNLALANTLKGLDAAQKVTIISQTKLTEVQKIGVLATSGLTAEELKNAVATGVLSNSQKEATTSTLALSTATKGLWATMKAHPIMTVTAAIGLAYGAYSKWKQVQEENRQVAEDAARAYADTSKSIDEYAKKYEELHTALLEAKGNEEETYNIKKQLLELQTELNEKFGDEYGKLNLVTDAYKDQTNAIKAFNKEAAKALLNDISRSEQNKAIDEMTSAKDYNLNVGGTAATTVEGQALQDLIKEYEDQGITSQTSDGMLWVYLNADPTSAEETINNFMTDVSELAKELGDEHIFDEVLDISKSSKDDAKKTISDWGDIYEKTLMGQIALDDDLSAGMEKATQAVQKYNEAVLQSEDSYNDKNVQKTYQDLQKIKGELQNDDEWSKYASVINEVFDQADTKLLDFTHDLSSTDYSKILDTLRGKSDIEAKALIDVNEGNVYKELISLADEYSMSINDVISNLQRMGIVVETVGQETKEIPQSFTKTEMISAINGLSEGFESLDKIMSSVKDKNPFNYALLNDKNFKDTFGDLGESYENFVEKVSKSPNDINACQTAFDDLLTTWLNSTDILSGLSEDTAQLTIDMLSNMGVANAETVVTEALAQKHAMLAAEKYYNANASTALANNTIDEYSAFLGEADAANVSEQALAQLELTKIAVNDVKIDTASDIDQVINLANAAGASAQALGKLARAKAVFAQAESGSLDLNVPGNNLLLAEAENTVKEIGNGGFEYEFKIDANQFKSATYGGGVKSGKSGSDGSKGSKGKEASEFDWMEQKIALLDSQVDKLKTNIESLVGYKNKNSMTNTAIDVLTEKMTVLQQMHDEYMKKASGLGLSQEYIDKVQNGTIEIESVGDENLAKVIKEYQDLYDKAQDTNAKILETQKSIHDLNLSKLDNIIDQFKQTTDIQSKMIDTEKQLLDLREKSGEEIYADDYISLAGKQLKLTRQNADAYNELSTEMSRMDLERGSEEWKKYNDQLQEYKNSMISAADAVEQYKDAMTDLVYKGLRDFTSAMDSINGTISTMNDLIGDTNLVDDFGNLTDRGLAQIALYAHQMTNAKQEAAEYAEAIKSLDGALDSGLITQDEYNSMLQDYTSAQENAVKSSKEARDAILALVKEGIQAEIDAKKKLIDETKAALDAEKDLHDYQKSITEKQDNISKLERQIAALNNSTNRDDIAQRLQLQSQLADAKDELYELQYDHEIEQRKNALDDEYNAFEESKQKESDELDTNLDAQNAAINKYLDQVKNNYSTVYGILTQYGDEYTLAAIDDLTKPWESGSEAADLCAGAIGDAVANIQYEIDSLDFSSLYELVDLLNQIGMGGYGGGSSSAYEDVTDQGSWQKGKGGKWWYGNSNDDYVSGDIYTINGKQYGFDDDGYMMTGWRDDFGDWRYFEPENGEMVISQWRKSKDGDWYYLDKDGVMATDMAVKARDGDGYYYLDENGKYDGKPLTAEQVRKLGYTIGYKKGRKRIPHDQLAWTQENKPELITRPSDSALLTPLKLGDGVINGDLTQNLLDIAGNPNRFVEDIVARSMPNYKIPEFDIIRNQPVAINSPLVQIDGTGLSATEVAAIIKNETRDIDKRVAKSIGYELMGK